MKHPKLKIRKKIRIAGIRKFKQEIKEIVHDCLLDIEYYIMDDLMKYLKKKGVIVYAKEARKKRKKGKSN